MADTIECDPDFFREYQKAAEELKIKNWLMGELQEKYGGITPGLPKSFYFQLRQVATAFGSLANVLDKRILDIGCGSNHLNSPWFCRALHLLGAKAVGVDFNDLEGENFEHHKLDITVPGALNLFPDHSFDGINMRGLAYLHCIKDEELRGVIEKEIPRQINRLLRPDGKIIVVQLDRYPDTCPINC